MAFNVISSNSTELYPIPYVTYLYKTLDDGDDVFVLVMIKERVYL